MKKKVLIIIGIVVLIMFCSGITYSIFHSNANMNSTNQNLAKFIFNAEDLDSLSLSMIDLKPGVNEEYSFSVSNNNDNKNSDVTIEYQIILKTYHFVPLEIKLYKITDKEELIMNCNETYTRNSDNELICNSDTQELIHTSDSNDNYKLKVEFPSEYNTTDYSDLVDYINIEIKSWQKISR